MLLLADRGFCGFPLWARDAATGADLLWRAMSNMKPRHIETLDDGTWLAELRPGANPGRTTAPLTIRVIDYQLDDGRANDTTYRLFTTLLDPAPSQRRAILPPQPEHGWRHAIRLLCQRLNPARRSRSNPRLIKRKYVKWHVKRARHSTWPQPTGPPTVTIDRSN